MREAQGRRGAAGPVSRTALAGLLVAAAVLLSGGVGRAGEQWGWLGVRIRDLTEQEMEEITAKLGLREGYGVLIAEVMPATPAQTAGVRDGDLIVAIDGRPIVETRALQRLVGRTPAGQEIALVVLRDRERREIRVRVGQMPPEAVAERLALEFGFFVREAAPEERPAEGAPRPPVVAGVTEGSAAAHGGLRAGDRVVAINDREVTSLEAFRQRLRNLFLRDPMRLTIERRGERRALTLPPVQPASYQ